MTVEVEVDIGEGKEHGLSEGEADFFDPFCFEFSDVVAGVVVREFFAVLDDEVLQGGDRRVLPTDPTNSACNIILGLLALLTEHRLILPNKEVLHVQLFQQRGFFEVLLLERGQLLDLANCCA